MSGLSGAPPAVKAPDLCKYFTLSDNARPYLQAEMTPEEFVQALAAAKQYPDAVQVIAHYMPKRQAVFWALSCAKSAQVPATPEADAAAKAAERWIAEPTEENRGATLPAADAADPATPIGCATLAAFYADGLPKTQDPKSNANAFFLTAKLAGGAVLLAATSNPDEMFTRFESFVQKGLEVLSKSKRG